MLYRTRLSNQLPRSNRYTEKIDGHNREGGEKETNSGEKCKTWLENEGKESRNKVKFEEGIDLRRSNRLKTAERVETFEGIENF